MLITKESTESFAKRESGGKGYNLYLLSREGFQVPPWAVIPAMTFKKFKDQAKLQEPITQAIQTLPHAEASAKVRDLIINTPLPTDIEALAKKAWAFVNAANTSPAKMIAVRSSGVDEDSAQFSFAGQLSTYLYVSTEQEALRYLKECWASGYSERGLSYRAQNNLLHGGNINVAVVFQTMIDSEKSGVMFTCDPIKKDPEKITINAVYGVGEGLVSGLLDADTFLIEKKTGKIISEEMVEKKTQLVRGPGQEGTQEVEVKEHLRNQPCLGATELQELAELGVKVEKYYRFPQDIEWGYREGKFYLLQSRPVTTGVKNAEGLLYIWDNSNIVESYGGITLPLTFTFAHHVYHWVYVQFCQILLVPYREIQKMDYFLRNMLGSFYGRVYYNILNWYKLTSILPGFKYNRGFMETMMGTRHQLADEIADRIKPPGFQETLRSKIMRTIVGFKFLYFHWTIQSMVDRFLVYFHEVYGRYRKLNYSRMTADDIYAVYQELEQKLLMEWKAPIVNDYLCMVHFGILKTLTAKWLSHLGETLHNDLLAGNGNLESAEPTRELIRMSQDILKNSELKKLLEHTPAEDCLEAVSQSSFKEFYQRVQRYIDLYGFRCMNEMKLEEKDLYQEPGFLFVVLKNYLRTGQTDLEAYEKREKEIREVAEKRVRENLGGLKLRIYMWSLKHARKAVRNRENTRFCRTRIYGIVRAMFNGMGRDFTARGIIHKPEDIFYITIPEMTGALEGTLTSQGLREIIEIRQKQYKEYEAIEPAPRFMTRGPVYWLNDHGTEPEVIEEGTAGMASAEKLPAHMLKGTPCCPGTVEGVVKVILSPKDNMELNHEILVTLRTDPGWIPLYPAASALLVERGGLLSHSAIVAREMGLPTIVGVKGLTQRLKSGMRIKMNGETGMIEILDENPTGGTVT